MLDLYAKYGATQATIQVPYQLLSYCNCQLVCILGHIDKIYRYPIFKPIAATWLIDEVPIQQFLQWPHTLQYQRLTLGPCEF